MWHSTLSYIKYRILRKSKRDIHSPFVFDYIIKGLENKDLKEIFRRFKSYKKALVKDKGVIKINDLGSGSRYFNSNFRKIKRIAKIAGISNEKAKILSKTIRYFKPQHILELGTSLGMSTYLMKITHPQTSVTTIEGCPETIKIAEKYLNRFQVDTVHFLQGDFSQEIDKLNNSIQFDLIYVDGNHTEKDTVNYYYLLQPHIKNNTLIIFDDIHLNVEMEKAWNFIKRQKNVTLSIDFFHIGIVFFRKESTKQHFILKY